MLDFIVLSDMTRMPRVSPLGGGIPERLRKNSSLRWGEVKLKFYPGMEQLL